MPPEGCRGLVFKLPPQVVQPLVWRANLELLPFTNSDINTGDNRKTIIINVEANKDFFGSTNHNDTGDKGKHLLLHLKEGGNQGTCGLAIRVGEGEVTQGKPTFHLGLRFQRFHVLAWAHRRKRSKYLQYSGCDSKLVFILMGRIQAHTS